MVFDKNTLYLSVRNPTGYMRYKFDELSLDELDSLKEAIHEMEISIKEGNIDEIQIGVNNVCFLSNGTNTNPSCHSYEDAIKYLKKRNTANEVTISWDYKSQVGVVNAFINKFVDLPTYTIIKAEQNKIVVSKVKCFS